MGLLLALNCGSSSIKSTLFTTPDLEPRQTIKASSIGTDQAKLKVGEKSSSIKGESHAEIVGDVLEALDVKADEIEFVTHRIVHGGTHSKPIIITSEHKEALDELDKLSAFAPLHNHHAVLVVREILKKLPKAKNVCCFDTLFHTSIPEAASSYALPSWAQKDKPVPLRRYGFHGLSIASILKSTAKYLNQPVEQTSLIVAHLGSGASMTCVKNGRSLDTTMGLTPLEGLIGGSRSGSVDPSLIFHLYDDPAETAKMVEQKGIKLAKGELALNKEAGLVGLCGTQEYGEIVEEARKGSKKHQHAIDVFENAILRYLGAYLLLLEGKPDAIIFSGGIGEKSAELRKSISQRIAYLGVKLDDKANEAAGGSEETVVRISAGGPSQVLRVLTDEERECAELALEHAS